MTIATAITSLPTIVDTGPLVAMTQDILRRVVRGLESGSPRERWKAKHLAKRVMRWGPAVVCADPAEGIEVCLDCPVLEQWEVLVAGPTGYVVDIRLLGSVACAAARRRWSVFGGMRREAKA